MAETLDLLAWANGLSGDIPQGVEQFGRAIELFRELGDTRGLASSISMRSSFGSFDETTYSPLTTLESFEGATVEALRLARQMDWLAGQAFVEFTAGSTFASFGEFGKALAHAREAVRIATESEHQQWMVAARTHLAQVYALMLQPTAAIQVLTEAAPLVPKLGSAWWVGSHSAFLALAYLMQGELPRAQAVLAAAMPREHTPRNLAERRMAWVWGQLAVAQGEPQAGLHIAEELIESAPGIRHWQPIPALLNLKGEALMVLDRLNEAEHAFEAAKEGARARAQPSLLWQIHAALGKLHRRRRRAAKAEREFAAARAIIQRLAATIEDTALREHFRRAAFRQLPPEKPLSPRQAGKNK